MTILVTGALGQVGKALVRKLLEEKASFIGLDKREEDIFPEVKIIHPEITRKEDIEKYSLELSDVDVLIHLASLITNDKDVVKSGPDSVDLNIKGTINLLGFLPNLKSITFSSTYMVYGTPISNPITEDHTTNPNLVYGASKLATEKFLQIFSKESGVNLSILRLMGIYGVEKPHGQAIPSFIKLIMNDQNPNIIGTGKEKRNHLHIDDAVNAILASINSQKTGTFNIGGPDSPSNLEIIDIINRNLNKKIEPIFKEDISKAYSFVTDTTKAKEELDFIPQISIENGIDRAINLYQKTGW